MRSAPRAVALAVPAGVVVATAWLRLEHPVVPLWRPVVLVALALAAAVPRRWLRAGAVVVASVAATRIAIGISVLPPHPLDPAAGFGLGDPLRALAHRFDVGLIDYYGTHLPFDPRLHAEMSEIGLAAIFCFTLLVAVLAAARQRVAAVLALIAGAGWPATLLGASRGIEVGAAILAAGLVLLARPSPRRLALALPTGVVVLVAAIAVGSATAARNGLVHWQSWSPIGASEAEVGAAFVWRSQYGGINWPAHPTIVLRVRSAAGPRYLRAGVLDDFDGYAWSDGFPRPADSLEPPAAFLKRNQTRELVTVEGLADTRLVGGSVPIRYSAGSAGLVVPEPGFASLPGGLVRGFQYTVWSYAPHPTAAELALSPAEYPAALVQQGLLGVGDGVELPPFAAPHRAASVAEAMRRHPGLAAYRPLFRLAGQVAGDARTPYAAVARLEQWFLGGRFRYSDHPKVVDPPLVGFVTTTHAGYCQYFAGAMALMLRYLGIPARVAVGFAGGTYDANQRAWLVTDEDAHAWVEVWFKGYGWLPFDPTPPVAGSAATRIAAGPGTAGTGGAQSLPTPGLLGRAAGADAAAQPAAGTGNATPHGGRNRFGSAPAAPASHGEAGIVLLLVLLVLAAALAGVVLTKRVIRAARRLDRDPRRIGTCCRLELTEFLVDQRIEPSRGATAQELGELVRRLFGIDTRRFVHAVTVARFGRVEHAGGAAADARRELHELLASIRRGLTRRERLAGLISIRSLGSRARPDGSSAAPGGTGS